MNKIDLIKYPKRGISSKLILSFESAESEVELPKSHSHVRSNLKKNDFVKLYQQKNSIHSGDREKANSIV